MKRGFQRFARTDWFGPLAIVVAASIGISVFDPSFLSPFNIQILLLAASVNCVIAMSQMIIIAHRPDEPRDRRDRRPLRDLLRRPDAGLAFPAAARRRRPGFAIGVAAGLVNGWLIARTGISAFIITLASLSDLQGRRSRHHARAAVLRHPREREGVRQYRR